MIGRWKHKGRGRVRRQRQGDDRWKQTRGKKGHMEGEEGEDGDSCWRVRSKDTKAKGAGNNKTLLLL